MDRNSVANLRKTTIYNTNVDFVNDNLYAKSGLIPTMYSQDIEQKPNYAGMIERERMTERMTDSVNPVWPHFSKRGYNTSIFLGEIWALATLLLLDYVEEENNDKNYTTNLSKDQLLTTGCSGLKAPLTTLLLTITVPPS